MNHVVEEKDMMNNYHPNKILGYDNNEFQKDPVLVNEVFMVSFLPDVAFI